MFCTARKTVGKVSGSLLKSPQFLWWWLCVSCPNQFILKYSLCNLCLFIVVIVLKGVRTWNVSLEMSLKNIWDIFSGTKHNCYQVTKILPPTPILLQVSPVTGLPPMSSSKHRTSSVQNLPTNKMRDRSSSDNGEFREFSRETFFWCSDPSSAAAIILYFPLSSDTQCIAYPNVIIRSSHLPYFSI